ncbi:MAG: VanZ family protein [Anaerolineales bacterium]
MLKTTAARLFGTLLGYIILVILLLTLNPFFLALSNQRAFTFHVTLDNFVANVLLFFPVGFFYRLATARRGAFWVGAALSFMIETLQIFIPARTSSLMDILGNGLGAGLGAVMQNLVSARLVITAGMLGRLRLETPLMGLIYLLVPLLWIDVLALPEAQSRWILTLLLSFCGAIIFSDLFRHWWKVVNLQVMGYSSLAVGSWILIGISPTLLRPSPILIPAVGALLFAALLTILPRSFQDRRFERNTLKRILPFFVLYLFLMALGFPFGPFDTWHAMFGFTDRITDTSLQSLYPRLEHLAAFTVLGYLIAEWRGRLELPLSRDLPRWFLIALGLALTLEFLSGFQSGGGASVVRLILAVAGALFGGTIYYLSRAHIRFLLGR